MAKSDSLFVTDAQCAERLGLTTEVLATALPALTKAGFPMRDPLFANRRYWPAVRAWLDRRYGMGKDDGMLRAPPGLDEPEPWKKK
ncbi:winged helix-turn-helix domain-containing protein [Rhizobium tropici]|uniref:Winged helix-turn-helix domain-containing protein n=1 Tax=Rhizobium tropici TaxID=398 RepID=A0A329YFZ3_RHITR|nr:winged helix-turn-helix domain-containing protein [Rhizobium tropici]RAX40752.1 winged helix-turn-helix domain-containing protein [Rhizobium tropici]